METIKRRPAFNLGEEKVIFRIDPVGSRIFFAVFANDLSSCAPPRSIVPDVPRMKKKARTLKYRMEVGEVSLRFPPCVEDP